MSDGVRSSLGGDPDDGLLLCAFVVCGVDQLPLDVLAAASGAHGATLRARLRRLAERGLVTEPTAGDDMVGIRHRPVESPSAQEESLALRIGRHLRDSTASTGRRDDVLRSVRWSVVGVMRWELGHGLAEDAVKLARAWWPVAGAVGDPVWMKELADVGERAAIELRDPAALIELLTAAAKSADWAGDWLMAEARWVRVLSLARAQKKHDVVCATLSELGDFYHRWGRLHRAMDVLSDLVATCDRVHDKRGALTAQRDLAVVLLEADRVAAAVPHLVRAVALAAEDDAIEDGAHAELLIMLGRAHWMSNKIRAGREAFSGALALLVDIDADGADHVRSLLATPDDGSLPLRASDAIGQRGWRPRPP
ncbi:hypothetical protein [Amycolatopsis sp. cmx-11-12]|uniref:hypothetical protein n=1 Tax=Amycolatopsis sp. cmx-11-12 TaxID=2785795 RepID=UPI00391804E6